MADGKLRSVGFFRELRHGDANGPSLRESICVQRHPEAASIVAYLREGHVVSTTGMSVHDALDPSKKYIAVLGSRPMDRGSGRRICRIMSAPTM